MRVSADFCLTLGPGVVEGVIEAVDSWDTAASKKLNKVPSSPKRTHSVSNPSVNNTLW